MKVLMTADAVGGVWTYALGLSAALSRHHVDVVLATMGPSPSTAQRQAAQQLHNVHLVTSNYRLEWMPDPWDEVDAASEWLLQIAEREAVDLVHLNGYAHAALPWDVPVLTVAHSCVCSWWLAVHGAAAPTEWDSYRRRIADGLNRSDCVIAPTEAFLRDLRASHSFQAPACVIYNGISPPQNRLDDMPQRLPIILACGRLWDSAKNLRALEDVAQRVPWHTYVAGDINGPDGSTWSSTTLRCLGALPSKDLSQWFNRSSVFVHPALYEPFGLAVLEAAMAGCALALADLPSLRELWEGAAEFFDPRDQEGLESSLRVLMEQPERRRKNSIAAQARARELNAETMAKAYADKYLALLKSQQRAVA